MEKNTLSGLGPADGDNGTDFPTAPEMAPADYLADMEGFDLTEAQKVELLHTLWEICHRFVDMGVDVGATDPCGQIFGVANEFPVDVQDSVQSSFLKATETLDGKEDVKE